MKLLYALKNPSSETILEPALTPAQRTAFERSLRSWYEQHARVLPWRNVRNPYRTWLSEVMLQQTRVNAVLEHYERFLRRFPTIISLALAPEEEVLAQWSGLGYYRRARMLHRTAKLVVEEYGGELPSTSAGLRRLPGIGTYTAAAIASIAFGESIAVVDGNVERVLLRVLGLPETSGAKMAEFLERTANALVPRRNAGDHNQAMMELGAMICTPRSPRCAECPVFALCRTRGEHPTLERTPMRSERVRYALTTRRKQEGLEVLLQRRPMEASLMANMLELPQLSMHKDTGALVLLEEPLLRVRHSIVGTNYYVEVVGMATRRDAGKHALRGDAMEWVPATKLQEVPLTGLARKVLQRMKLMKLPSGMPQEVPLLIGRGGRASAGKKG
ncbi:A/G-specific adenine glycosylase [Terriglobus roseus]|uniref:Adenine DNA glycosylase n=1 Tax=Terriglobus roseus TaxID=392734 RepID=A0A1G7P5Q4_9BACT|nr:A/G-specific DNA-adenine glycosylase [Terriglobus roseus]